MAVPPGAARLAGARRLEPVAHRRARAVSVAVAPAASRVLLTGGGRCSLLCFGASASCCSAGWGRPPATFGSLAGACRLPYGAAARCPHSVTRRRPVPVRPGPARPTGVGLLRPVVRRSTRAGCFPVLPPAARILFPVGGGRQPPCCDGSAWCFSGRLGSAICELSPTGLLSLTALHAVVRRPRAVDRRRPVPVASLWRTGLVLLGWLV